MNYLFIQALVNWFGGFQILWVVKTKKCKLKILEYCNDFDMFQDIVIESET